jgi:hypothetical protein
VRQSASDADTKVPSHNGHGINRHVRALDVAYAECRFSIHCSSKPALTASTTIRATAASYPLKVAIAKAYAKPQAVTELYIGSRIHRYGPY